MKILSMALPLAFILITIEFSENYFVLGQVINKN